MARTDPQINLRIPGALKEELEAEAMLNRRSFTAEVVARLQASLDGGTGLTLPEETLQRLKAEAKKSGRTLEGELYARMLDSLADRPPAEVRLRQQLEAESKQNNVLRSELEELQNARFKSAPFLYVLLDASGHPISWHEISEHLQAIHRAGGFNPSSVHTTVLTPEQVSSSARAQEEAELAAFYRSKGRSTFEERLEPVKKPARKRLRNRLDE